MFTIAEILNAVKGKLIFGTPETIVSGISIDSRTINPGDLFIAIKGKRLDGHDFINQALKKGAGAVLVSQDSRPAAGGRRPIYIRTPDTTDALGALARYHRRRFDIPVIGVTGSNGKTTTKEMLWSLLCSRLRVLKNQGTENNLFGLPLTLLKLNPDYQAAVIEMGASEKGEITALAEIAAPTIGVITNIGPSHLQGLGTLDLVAREKCALLSCLEDKGTAVLNADDEQLMTVYAQPGKLKIGKTLTFAVHKPADFRAEKIQYRKKGISFLLNNKYEIDLPLLGLCNVYNALSAIAACSRFSLDYAAIKKTLAAFSPPYMRMELKKAKDMEIINDCYNSNPLSMAYAIRVLAQYDASGRRILVSGDMLELGEKVKEFHSSLGRSIARAGVDILVTVGELSRDTAREAIRAGMRPDLVWSCKAKHEAVEVLSQIIKPRDVVLVKGSRSMQMEEIVKAITG